MAKKKSPAKKTPVKKVQEKKAVTKKAAAPAKKASAKTAEKKVSKSKSAAEQKTVSASLIQRRFRLGYPRAARIVETMETEGVVGPQQGSKPREVLVNNLPT